MSSFGCVCRKRLLERAALSMWALGTLSSGAAYASTLSDTAASLSPGEWSLMSTGGFNNALLLRSGHHALQYTETLRWDPQRGEAHLVGGGHYTGPRHIVYSEGSNGWSSRSLPSMFTTPMHGYDHLAIDPVNRRMYHRFFNGTTMGRYDLDAQSWTQTASVSGGVVVAGAIEWFPEYGRVVFVNGDFGVSAYNPANNQWNSVSGSVGALGAYHNFAEYSPVHKVVIFGGGDGGGAGTPAIWRMDANGSIQRLRDAPAALGITHAIVTLDPNSGNFIVLFNNRSWYEFNPITDTWSQLPGTPPVLTAGEYGGVWGAVATPIPTYGVIMFAKYDHDNSRVWLYRHSPGSGVPQPTVSLSANPTTVAAQGSTELTWSSSGATSCTASGAWTGAKALSGNETSSPLAATSTFTLTCSNTAGGTRSRSVTVTVAGTTPPTVTFDANPATVASGGSSTLSWTTSDATACTGSGGITGWAGAKAVPSGSQSVGPINASTTFNLSCTGTGGTTQRSVTVNLQGTPTINLSANPASVAAGGRSMLTWSTQNASTCTAAGGWAGNKAVSGTEQTPVLSATTTFDLSCTGSGGSASASTTVAISNATPTVTLSAAPPTVAANGTTTLTWSSTNASSCVASGGWSGTKALAGTQQTSPLSSSTTFTLECTGSGMAVTRSVTVAVTGQAAEPEESGGGAIGVIGLIGLLLARLRRIARALLAPWLRTAAMRSWPILLLAGCASVSLPAHGFVNGTVRNLASSAASSAPVTFGHVFKPGDVPAGATLTGRLSDGTVVPLQLDVKASHRDGSARHAVVTGVIPSVGANGSRVVTIERGAGATGTAIGVTDLLATAFDATISVNIGGTVYTASARDLLQNASRTTWLSGPLVSEWHVSAPLRTSGGSAHPHLAARFEVRAYQGLQRAWVSATVENTWTFAASPRAYTYDVVVSVAGKGTQLTQDALVHCRQSRWRRTFWWGADPQLVFSHDSAYLMATGHVPNYDPTLDVPEVALAESSSDFTATAYRLGARGTVYPYMPGPGARPDIGPLPRWSARHVLSQDLRVRREVLGNGEQAGSWPIHSRDQATGLPVSIVTNPDYTAPDLGGTCNAGGSEQFVPDSAHQPSLAYYPYLITGDYFFLEELHFWANWNVLQASSGDRNRSEGLHRWDQVRGQGWSMRTLGQAAAITPDAHPLKSYFETQLTNNLRWYDNRFTNNASANRLGVNDTNSIWDVGAWLQYNAFVDDFFTWAIGHVVDLGYTEASGLLAWKAKFPVGRMNDPGGRFCWIFAATYRIIVGVPATGIFQNFGDAYVPTLNYIERSAAVGTPCASSAMASATGLRTGEMDGDDYHAEGYPSNMQPALAQAVNAGVPGAQQAWDRYYNRPFRPGVPFSRMEYTYDYQPAYAIVPRGGGGSNPRPSVTLTANPGTIAPGGNSTLSWSTTNATSCTASGGWSGSRSVAGGSEEVGPLQNNTAFTLACTGAGGSTQQSVTVNTSTAPIITFTANPTSVTSGGRSTLTWNAQQATGCQASGAWSGNKAASGSEQTAALTASSDFMLTCTGSGGTTQATTRVTVGSSPPGAPVVTLTAAPTTVQANGTTTLTWSATNATSCTASGAWSGTRGVTGTATSPALTTASTFTLTCTGSGGSGAQSVTVDVTSNSGGGEGDSGGGRLDLLLAGMLLLAAVIRLRSGGRVPRFLGSV